MARGGAQSFQGYSPCLASSSTLTHPRERGPWVKGRQERAALCKRARKATLGTAREEQGPSRSCRGGTDCNSFCLRWAKHSRSISRKRLFWSKMQNIVFAQLNSPTHAFSLKPRQLSGRRFPSSLPLHERQCSSPQPISEPGSGVKGLPEFMALITEPLPSRAGIERHRHQAPHMGQPPWSSLGHPGDSQVCPPHQGGLRISPFIANPLGSPLCTQLPASFFPRPDSLQLPSRPPRIPPQSHHSFIPPLAGLQGWRRSPHLSSPILAQPH